MSKSEVTSKRSRKSKVEELFLLADKEWNRGKARSAFRLFHAAAKAGNIAAQVNLGCSYDHGIGVWRNQLAAFSWYKRACRRGDASAANKIGTIWGDEQKPQRAFYWFERAVSLGDDGSNLEIAKHYLQNRRNPRQAIDYLNIVCQSDRVSESESEKAMQLLQETKKQLRRRDRKR